MQGNGVNEQDKDAITGEQFTGLSPVVVDRQRTFGAGASYAVDAMTFGAVWTQSHINNNAFDSSNVINNYEVNAHYTWPRRLWLWVQLTRIRKRRRPSLALRRRSTSSISSVCRLTMLCRSAPTSTSKP